MNRSAGYTLLEMVVVLALLGLATAMVAPATFRMIQSWRDADEVTQVLAGLAALPATARDEGRQIRLDPPAPSPASSRPRNGSAGGRISSPAPGPARAAAFPLALPEGWRLDMDSPLVVQPNGSCNGSTGTLVTTRQTIRIRVEAPFCRVGRLPAGAS